MRNSFPGQKDVGGRLPIVDLHIEEKPRLETDLGLGQSVHPIDLLVVEALQAVGSEKERPYRPVLLKFRTHGEPGEFLDGRVTLLAGKRARGVRIYR